MAPKRNAAKTVEYAYFMSTSVEPADAVTGPDPGAPEQLRRRAVRGGAILMATRLVTQAFLWSVTLLVARLVP